MTGPLASPAFNLSWVFFWRNSEVYKNQTGEGTDNVIDLIIFLLAITGGYHILIGRAVKDI